MNVKNPLLFALGCLALCALLSSCVVTSENPLSPPGTAQTDPRLVGSWLQKNDQTTFRITVKTAPWMHVDVVPSDPRDKGDSYDFYPTVIGKNTFLNVVLVSDDKEHPKKAYTFIRYTISDGGTLQMWKLSQDAAAAAIKAGKIKGVVHQAKDAMMVGNPPRPDIDVALTDSSAAMTKFVADSDAVALFNDKMEPLERSSK